MGFTSRRKSSSIIPTLDRHEADSATARRLTKPRTNKSVSNLRLQALQQLEDRVKSGSTASLPLSPQLSGPVSPSEFNGYNPETDFKILEPSTSTRETSPRRAVALMVKSFEARHSAEQVNESSAPESKQSRRPLSLFFRSRRPSSTSVKTKASNASREAFDASPGTPTSTARSIGGAGEELQLTPTRIERRSSYKPGVATRHVKSMNEGAALICLEENDATDDDIPRPSIDEWVAPPCIVRPETPSDLEATHIGRLRLGSLQIVNGRASPAPSELSKHLFPSTTMMLRRDTSSDYGDDEPATLLPIASLLPPLHQNALKPTEIPEAGQSLSVEQDRYRLLPPLEPVLLPGKVTANLIRAGTPERIAVVKRKPLPQPDETIAMAHEYMAEMPDSPYKLKDVPAQNSRSSSPSGSVVITSKMNEVDDHLFEDEGFAGSIYCDDDKASVQSFYTITDTGSAQDERFVSTCEFSRVSSPEKLQNTEPVVQEQNDSGYNSNASNRDDISETAPSEAEKEVSRNVRPALSIGITSSATAVRTTKFRPISILKQNRTTASVLPTFSNLRLAPSLVSSTTSLPSDDSGVLSPMSPKSPKKGRKLQKRRPLSQPAPVSTIAVQGASHTLDTAVPNIPQEVRDNLAIRTREVPELERTFKSMQHTKRQSVSTFSFQIPDITFPSPTSPVNDVKVMPRRPSIGKRASFLGHFRKENGTDRPQDHNQCSRAEAFEALNGYGNVVSSLGPNPYAAVPSSRAAEAGPNIKHQLGPRKPRPRSMMDDDTAAEVARHRSKLALEREWHRQQAESRITTFEQGLWHSSRPSRFRDSYNPPPVDAASPPQVPHDNWTDSENVSTIWHPPMPRSREDIRATRPMDYWPQPLSLGQSHHSQQHGNNSFPMNHDSLAPPPPSHSPKPNDVEYELEPEDWTAEVNVWHAQAQQVRQSFEDTSSFHQIGNGEADEPLYPAIPPRHRYHNRRTVDNGQYGWLDPTEQRRPSGDQQHPQRAMTMPEYDSYGASPVERPRSRASQFSNAGSLAESLHPPDVERSHPAPDFGRYSGGMQYAFERDAGFGGSAGTRSISGKAGGTRKGVALRASHGVDLGDVPVITGLRRF